MIEASKLKAGMTFETAAGNGGLGTVLSGCGSRRTTRPTDHRSSPASFGVTSDFQL